MRGVGIRLPAASGGRGRDRRPRAPVPIFSFSTKNPRGLSMLGYGLSVDRTLPPSPRFSLITRFSYSPATTRRIIRALPNAPRSLTSGFSSPPATTRRLIRAPDSATAAFPPIVSITLIPDRRSWGILVSQIFRLARVSLLFSWNRGLADQVTRDPETGSASLIFAGVRLSPADRIGRFLARFPSARSSFSSLLLDRVFSASAAWGGLGLCSVAGLPAGLRVALDRAESGRFS